MSEQIGLSLRVRPILFVTRMITDRTGLHSVLLPLLIPVTRPYSLWKLEKLNTENSFFVNQSMSPKHGLNRYKQQLHV